MYLTVQEEGKMSWTVSDAVNYKGFPADKSKTGGWTTASLILGLHLSLPLTELNSHLFTRFSLFQRYYSCKYISYIFPKYELSPYSSKIRNILYKS